MLQLIVHPGLPDERFLPLREGLLRIGRTGENELCIGNQSLSRRHAQLELAGGRVTLTDLQSKNGTFVRGARISQCELKPGDSFTCGDVAFLLVSGAPLTAAGQEPQPALTQALSLLTHVSMKDLLSESGTQLRSALRVKTSPPAERDRDKLRLLLQVSQLLSSPGTIDTLLERVLELLFQILDVDRAALLLVEPGTGRLIPRVARTHEGPTDSPLVYSEHIVDYVRHHSVAALFSDARVDPRLGDASSIFGKSIHAALCVPLKPREELLGVLYADNRRVPDRFTQEDLDFLSAFANQAAIALENSQLYQRLEQEAVLRSTYQRFFPPATLKRLALSPGAGLGALETEVTALFSDICGFTQLSSRLRPSQVVELLNEYFPVMADIVFAHEGTLEKYIGDALMAVWGAPFSHEDDADRALRAAVEMQQALVRLNERWRERGQVELQIHIGLNTGPVAAGNIGSERYLQYATIGDTTNVASRVCGVAGPGEIMITQATRERLVRHWPLEPPQPTPLRGKPEPVVLYRVPWAKDSAVE